VQAETDLDALIGALSPKRRPGEYVFVVSDSAEAAVDADVLASVVEPEGLSLVLAREDADRIGLSYSYVAGWIILEVHSALDAVGLTAAVAGALSQAGISCNVVAGYHHDHLFVVHERVDEAIAILQQLKPISRAE
jgi:hypothetical protein